MSTMATTDDAVRQRVNARLRRMLAVHFDPRGGSAFWLERQHDLGFCVVDTVREVGDLDRLGTMVPADLAERPLLDFVPRSLHASRADWVLGQTGGTTGRPVWTAYRDDEFVDAFVTPFVRAADHVGFPRGVPWLYVGPSGPHIIGRAARHLARRTAGAEPFTVDFDPRWARTLAEGSFAAERYLDHVADQAMDVFTRQDVGVLFTTPSVLARLAGRMTSGQRDRVRGVHYGGQALDVATLADLQCGAFPNAVHLSGYGNTLFGCCLEMRTTPGRSLDYFAWGDRLLLDVIDDEGRFVSVGQTGRIRFTRLDETVLIVRMIERDQAERVELPSDAPAGFLPAGVCSPEPLRSATPTSSGGLY